MNTNGNTQVATKNDMQALRSDLEINNKTLRAELKTAEGTLRAEIKTTEKNLQSELKITEKTLRSEIKTTEKKLRTEILRVEEKVETLQEGQEKMTSSLTRLQNTLDGFVGTVDELRNENIVDAHQIKEHDVRITKLESSSHSR